MKLEFAEILANKIKEELSPFCSKIAIAGSIRRGRAEVDDIDIVCLPKDRAALRERILRSGPRILTDGPINMIVELKGPSRTGGGVQLDIFMASDGQPTLFGPGSTNYGSLLLCRTGSKAHNIHMIESAKRRGLTWDPYWGVKDSHGDVIACESEEGIFDALGMKFVEPHRREPP